MGSPKTYINSMFIVNRALTHFVSKKITKPIDLLVFGVHELRDGNLGFRIEYNGNNEFKSVCDDFNYIGNIQTELPDAVSMVTYTRAVEINLLAKGEDSVVKYETSANDDGGMGAIESYELTYFIGKTILKVIPNDAYYTQNENGLFVPASVSEYGELYENGDGVELIITGILRIKENSSSLTGYLSTGLVYTTALTDYIVDNAGHSKAQMVESMFGTMGSVGKEAIETYNKLKQIATNGNVKKRGSQFTRQPRF